jgi:hypothetical protein
VDRGWRETDLPCWPRPASNHAPTRIHHLPPPLTLATAASVVQGIRATRAYRLRFGQVQVVHRPPRFVPAVYSQRENTARGASAGRRGIYSKKRLAILPWTAGSHFFLRLGFRLVHCARTSARSSFSKTVKRRAVSNG